MLRTNGLIAVTNLGHVEGPKNSSAPFPDRLEPDHRPLFGLSSTAQSPVLTINMDVLVATDFVTTEVWTWGGLVTYMPSKSTSLTIIASACIKARGICADQQFPASEDPRDLPPLVAEGKPKPKT